MLKIRNKKNRKDTENRFKTVDLAYGIWLAAAAVLVVYLSFYELPVGYYGKSRNFGLVGFCLLDLIGLIICVQGRLDGSNGTSILNKMNDPKQRRRFLFSVLAGTAVYIMYCELDRRIWFWGTEIHNALVASALMCVSILIGTGWKNAENTEKMQKPKEK